VTRILTLVTFTTALVVGVVVGAVAPASANTDDFVFASFNADYTLPRDDDGRSTLTTVETLVAVFPEFDQNRGIRRELFTQYDGHPIDLQIVSIADETGASREYQTDEGRDVVTLTIAGADYVHGKQTYFAALALAVTGLAGWLRRRKLRDAPSCGIIVPEYLPPKDANLLLSAVIIGETARAIPAQIITLAVAGKLRIIERSGKSRKAVGR
jgi:hypothetical protein